MNRHSSIRWILALLAAIFLLPAALTAQQVTLKFACWDYDLYPHDKALIQEFQKDNPDIKVEVISIPNADYDSKVNIMTSAARTSTCSMSRASPCSEIFLQRTCWLI
jgi:ABC-type glycerol-3-phosphate transport system substrate-binding protein